LPTETSLLVLLPALVTVVTAILSRRPIESLLAGVFVGLLMLEPAAALSNFSSILLDVMMDETIAWIIIVCGLMGSLITLLMRVGAANAFSRALSSKAKSSRTALLYTWLLGLVVFIDDYLNALAVGSSMRKVTDKFKVSREMCWYQCLPGPCSTPAYLWTLAMQNQDRAWPFISVLFPIWFTP